MPDKDKKIEEVFEVKESPKPSRKKAVKLPPPVKPKKKLYTFDQWAARNGVPVHHRGGMRAFVSNVNKSRSLEAWDALFSSY